MEYRVRHEIVGTGEWAETITPDYKEACLWFNCKISNKSHEKSVVTMFAPDGSVMFKVTK